MPKQPKLPFAKSHAFLIGIDDYLHITPLSTAIKDAEDIANLLGDPTKHAYETHLLKNPSREEMEVFFAETKEIVQPEDRVLIYFAGHGIALDSEGDPEGFLVPVDAKSGVRESLFPMTRLHELLESLPCKHGLLILDCCFAGAFKWSTGFRDMVMDFGQVMYEERFWRFVEHPAWQVITSTSHDQKAADVLDMNALGLRETPTTDTRNSPFAWALKKVIDKDSQVDLHAQKQNKGVITATQLYLHVRDIVEGASHFKGKKQSPAIFSLSRHDSKGEFVFLKPGHPLNLKKAPNLNPYKGLGAYDGSEKDIGIFFGRSQAIQELSRRVAQQTLVVVSAPSGQGKSSVIRAGLLPFLKQDGFTDQIEIRPDDKDHSHWEEITRIQPDQKGVLYLDQFEELFALPDADRAKLEGLLIDLWQRFAQTEEPKARIILSIRSDFEWQLQASEFGSRFWQEEARTDFLYRLAPMSLEELREAVIRPAWSMAYEFESEEMVDQILEEINHAPGALPLLSFTLHQLYEKRDRKKRQLTLTAYRDELGRVNGALSKHADRIYESLPDDDHRDFMKKLVLRMVMLNDGSYSRRKVYRQTSSTLKKGGFIDEFDYPDHLDPVKDAVLDILEDALLIRSGKDDLGKYVEPMHDSLLNYWPRCLEWIKEFGHEHLVLQRQIWQAVVEHHQWVKPDTLLADGSVPQRPLWDSNPKLQQVQISVMDPQDRWLCYNPEPGFSVASTASMLWHTAYPEGNPLPASWSEAFQSEEAGPRYEEVRDQMNHWLNEDELEFVKESFERQADRLEQMRKQRDEAIRDKKIAEQKTRESEVSAMAIKAQQQEPINPVVALNLAIRAHQAYPTSETINTLALIDSNADNQYYFAQQKVDIEGIEVFAQFIPGTRKVLCQYNWHFRIWDLDDPAAEPEKVRSLHRPIRDAAQITPDGTRFLSHDGGVFQLYPDLKVLADLRPDEDSHISKTYWTTHQKRILSLLYQKGNDEKEQNDKEFFQLWHGKTYQPTRSHPKPLGNLLNPPLHPDGKYRLVLGKKEQHIFVWHVASRLPVKWITQHQAKVIFHAFSPDQRYLLSADEDGKVLITRLRPGGRTRVFTKLDSPLTQVCFAPKSQQVFLALQGESRDGHTQASIEQRSFPDGILLHRYLGHERMIMSLSLSDDERFLVSAGKGEKIRAWEVANDDLPMTFYGEHAHVHCLGLSPDGKSIYAGGFKKMGGGFFQVWDTAQRKPLENNTRFYEFSAFQKIIFALQGDRVTLIDSGGRTLVYHPKTQSHLELVPPEKASSQGAYTSDGQHFMLAAKDRPIIYRWSTATWDQAEEQLPGEVAEIELALEEEMVCFTLSPDGRYAMAFSMDDRIRVWEIGTQQLLFEQVLALSWYESESKKASALFSPKGKYLCLLVQRSMYMFEVADGRLMWEATPTTRNHRFSPSACTFSPSEEYLLYQEDRFKQDAIHLAQVSNKQVIHSFQHIPSDGTVRQLGFSPDEKSLYAAFYSNSEHAEYLNIFGWQRSASLVGQKIYQMSEAELAQYLPFSSKSENTQVEKV